jgi:hypothetical protein
MRMAAASASECANVSQRRSKNVRPYSDWFALLSVVRFSKRRKAAGFYEIESRVWMFTDYYSISPEMASQIPGKGAAYEIAFNDVDGKPLSGDVS